MKPEEIEEQHLNRYVACRDPKCRWLGTCPYCGVVKLLGGATCGRAECLAASTVDIT